MPPPPDGYSDPDGLPPPPPGYSDQGAVIPQRLDAHPGDIPPFGQTRLQAARSAQEVEYTKSLPGPFEALMTLPNVHPAFYGLATGLSLLGNRIQKAPNLEERDRAAALAQLPLFGQTLARAYMDRQAARGVHVEPPEGGSTIPVLESKIGRASCRERV